MPPSGYSYSYQGDGPASKPVAYRVHPLFTGCSRPIPARAATTEARSDSVGSHHLFALLGAAFAHVGTSLAMIHLMLAAFLSARTADIRADAADLLGGVRLAGHECRGCKADFRTVAKESDTASQFLYIVFPSTSGGTTFSFDGTFIAGFDAVFAVLSHVHKYTSLSSLGVCLQIGRAHD